MAGNVSEWVADYYGEPFPSEEQTNPTGPASGTQRVVRYNDWESLFLRHTRSSARAPEAPAHRTSYIGFRCAAKPL